MVAIPWISCLNNLRIARTVFASWMIADRKAAHSVLSSVLAGRLRPCMISRRRFLKTKIVTSSVAEISSLLPFRSWIKRIKMMDLICRSYINFNKRPLDSYACPDQSNRNSMNQNLFLDAENILKMVEFYGKTHSACAESHFFMPKGLYFQFNFSGSRCWTIKL